MKLRNILPLFALSTLLLTSCDDQIMSWYKDPTHGEIASSELPLQLAEKIQRYDKLNAYTNSVLGIGIDLTMYMENEDYRNVINANFDQVTIGYDMKHGAMVNSKGEINFTKVDALLVKLKEAGLTVYGHTLVWHSNQNASYLNSLIADNVTITPDDDGINLLPNGDFENGMTGWNKANVAGSVDVVDYAGVSGSKVLKITNTNNDGAQYKTQVQGTFATTWESGKIYTISLWVKSEAAGKFRVSFSNNKSGNYSDCHYQGDENSTGSWKQYTYEITAGFSSGAIETGISLDFGGTAGTYYVDKVVVGPKQAPNLLTNGSFESDLTGWNKANVAGEITVISDASAIKGSKLLKIVNTNTNGAQYKTQIQGAFPTSWESGKTYSVSLWVKSEATGKFRISCTNDKSGNYSDCHYQGDENTSSSWKQYSYQIIAGFTSGAKETGISLDFGGTAGTYYVDDVVVRESPAAAVRRKTSTGVIITPKTDAEKTQIIGNAMSSWISSMMTHYKDQVTAWDVVNEPMKEDGTVRDGNVTSTSADEFYWVKYLGKDYAATAFKLARQYGNATDKLFINDYNLESNLTKCDGLIEYVKYIESKDVKVDGIGTQMHISISTDTTKIDQMFQKLAATGKLIKVSELDVKVNTKTPTTDNYAAQARMYQYVAKSFMKYVPEAQRYGITVWAVSDNVKEHTNWIPDDAPCLWDKDYARKHAYKGFADGLAGEDVSSHFSGDLQY